VRQAALAAQSTWSCLVDRGTQGLLDECRTALNEGHGHDVLDGLLVEVSTKQRTSDVHEVICALHCKQGRSYRYLTDRKPQQGRVLGCSCCRSDLMQLYSWYKSVLFALAQ